MQSNRWLQTLIVLLVIMAALVLIGWVWSFVIQFSSIILLFFLSWLLAFAPRALPPPVGSAGRVIPRF